ncbi:hypothetical protein YC2023_090634 [Brassica napus]
MNVDFNVEYTNIVNKIHIPNYPPKGVQRPNGRDVKSVVAKTRTRVAGSTAVPPLPPSYERLLDKYGTHMPEIDKGKKEANIISTLWSNNNCSEKWLICCQTLFDAEYYGHFVELGPVKLKRNVSFNQKNSTRCLKIPLSMGVDNHDSSINKKNRFLPFQELSKMR